MKNIILAIIAAAALSAVTAPAFAGSEDAGTETEAKTNGK